MPRLTRPQSSLLKTRGMLGRKPSPLALPSAALNINRRQERRLGTSQIPREKKGLRTSRFPYSACTACSRLFCCGSRLFVGVFYCKILLTQCCENKFLFLPVPATLGIPLPALSSLTSRRLLSRFTSGFPPPCPYPPPPTPTPFL